jgi:hypothetical protein
VLLFVEIKSFIIFLESYAMFLERHWSYEPLHSGLPRGHNKNDKIQKKSYFYQIQSILTLWQKIDFLFFIYF